MDTRSRPCLKPIVIGLYGVPGSGKTYLLKQLMHKLGQEDFAFYEGSEIISKLVDGGLDAFKMMDEGEKNKWREKAIQTIRKECRETNKVGTVAGHLMFWAETKPVPASVLTPADLRTYTHIIYLNIDPDTVVHRTLKDKNKTRAKASVPHIAYWQQEEKIRLRKLCLDHEIFFTEVSNTLILSSRVFALIKDFATHDENYNTLQAQKHLDGVLGTNLSSVETVLAFDADRTLAAEDTGKMFWDFTESPTSNPDPLKELFSGPSAYSYAAFRRATLLYEDVTKYDGKFDADCKVLASTVTIYPGFITLLRRIAQVEHVTAVVITCGLRTIWEKVLERVGLSDEIKVIGGGRISDGYVVTPALKAALVARMQNVHRKWVLAFGDSPMDLEMLSQADAAIVVVGNEQTRSKTMDIDLGLAIRDGRLRAHQTLLPNDTAPRLDPDMLPVVDITNYDFMESIFNHRGPRHRGFNIVHAGDKNAAKLLTAPTRDAEVAGPMLREVHRRVGWYLATEYVSDVIGLEEYPITHVQGTRTHGHRLLDEQKTCIVALMRGGEPMAFGVNDTFPLAMFVHANSSTDLNLHHLEGMKTVILVDSVINSGKTIVEFVEHVLKLASNIRILVVTGVAQRDCISKGGIVYELASQTDLTLVALRLSDNKFTGQGTTDTGNRLFSTTHIQ